ncbi:MAG: FAD-dependent monooxygenase, partial [Gammaproteobacteria bacterium]
ARTLLGADGAGSAIRRAMQQQLGVQASEEMLGHAYKELTIPPDLAGRHQMEPEALHIWPRGGFMLIALPNLDGSFTVTLFLPREGDPGFDQLADADRLTAFFRTHFADVVDKLPTLVEDFFTNPTGSLGTVRCRPWHHEGRVLLLGDAAHAIVPFHGQGMNCAFEDCLVLDRCLDAADGDWVRAFADYDQLRKLDADAIADMALENYVEMRDSVRDPGFRLRKELGFELERRYPDRFIPRYSMVMFHHLPYAEAQERGAVQARILKSLTEGVENLSDVDWNEADRLVNADLPVMPGD